MPISASLRSQRRLRLRILEFYGGKCVQCGFDDWRALQLDHIIPLSQTGEKRVSPSQTYRDAERNPDKYQLLCANCNAVKCMLDGSRGDDDFYTNREPQYVPRESQGTIHPWRKGYV